MIKVAQFDELENNLLLTAGGKGASLSKMHKAQLQVPNGFIVCVDSFTEFILTNKISNFISDSINNIDMEDNNSIEKISKEIRTKIMVSQIPEDTGEKILEYYSRMGENVPVAIRSSSTAEDLDDASFAGQQETFLYVIGKEQVLNKIKECWASLYNARAIFYRKQKHFNERNISIAVVVQKMVNSEKSGVMFTVNPINKNINNALIEAIWGLGEGIVSGTVTPDSYSVDKCSKEILQEYISEKEIMVTRDISMSGIQEEEVSEDKKNARVLTNKELSELSSLAIKLENFFGKPQDIEWAIEEGQLYLLQSRPITTL